MTEISELTCFLGEGPGPLARRHMLDREFLGKLKKFAPSVYRAQNRTSGHVTFQFIKSAVIMIQV
jgi:hypothetical protein